MRKCAQEAVVGHYLSGNILGADQLETTVGFEKVGDDLVRFFRGCRADAVNEAAARPYMAGAIL